MSSRAPLSRLYTGKPGRPLQVRNLARNLIRETVVKLLVEFGIVPTAVTAAKVDDCAKWIATESIDKLTAHDLRIVPGAVARELALFVGEPAQASTSLAPTVGADSTKPKEP